MKNCSYKLALSGALLAAACFGLYGQGVYLAEAANKPFERNSFIDGGSETLRYTAFYSGAVQPQEDITVTFSVDPAEAAAYNARCGTAFKMLPEGSYSMEITSAVIPAGSVSASPGEVKITGSGRLKPFERYILPVTATVANGPAAANPELSTIYYIITAVPAPGEVARKQIGRLPSGTAYILGMGGRYLIAADGDGGLAAYRYMGGKLGKGVPVEGAEHLEGMDNIRIFRDHHIVGLIRSVYKGQLWSFPITPDAGSILPMDKIFGTYGYGDFSDIYPFGNNLYCLYPSGELMIFPLSDRMEWIDPGVRSLGSGWNYQILFGYGNSLIGIEAGGDMWRYTLDRMGMPGIPVRIGSGWNCFTQIAVLGRDLAAMDTDGVVWQIKFDDKLFWAL